MKVAAAGLALAFVAAPSMAAATPGEQPQIRNANGSEGCIPVEPDNPLAATGQNRYTDNNPTMYVENDARFHNHEGEGPVIIGGDATFTNPEPSHFH